MNEIKVFENPAFGQVRTMDMNGEPWFVGKDVAEALGYSNSRDAIAKHVEEDDKLVSRIATVGQNRNIAVINESGLYSLILSSKLPAAKQFKHWITSEVLPSIRRTSGYGQKEHDTEIYLEAARIMATCKPENREIVIQLLGQAVPMMQAYAEQSEQIHTAAQKTIPPKETPFTKRRSNRISWFNTELLQKLYYENETFTMGGLARELGLNLRTVKFWVHGDGYPTRENAVRLAHYLGVPGQQMFY